MKPKIIIGIVIIVAAIVYLIVGGMKETAVYYLKVSEARARTNVENSKGMRISGDVVPGSINWQPELVKLEFLMTDHSDTIRVSYDGVKPDQLLEGQQVIAEGKIMPDGTFKAGTLMTKCPSKYENKDRGY